ncbi:hypothetical protein HZH68_014071 [Vespula germanica]|uniref:Uncharacterized protein n=1 Tax=Vespula germanica TaxID=30212 RepID=A0A834J9S5_VESGE|nr:hypothetical protein HZH68_014071 [Vespula germanica]
MQLPPRGGTWVDFDSAVSEDFDNLPPGMDLEILVRSSRNGSSLDFYTEITGTSLHMIDILLYANDRENTHARAGRHVHTTGRVSRCLKLTVWTVSFSDKPDTPETERHFEREIRIESPLARGSPDAATSSRWDLGR